jgi:Cys-tRNA(Pro)/Cys-tRNA(Cys) deacylase
VSTRAIAFLETRGIPHEVVVYRHREKGAAFAAAATGFPLERTVKTLVAALDRGGFCLALVPGHRELDLKRLAAVLGVKRAAMADTAAAERLTGYLAGGISPFATRQRIPAVMERTLVDLPDILINAGQRGRMLRMDPKDVQSALGCTAAAIAR